MNSIEVRERAVRDFLVGLGLVSAVIGIPLYFHLTSSLPGPLKTAVALVLVLAWILGGIGLASLLKRDLTPVELGKDSLRVGRWRIPYEQIAAVDREPSKKRVFRVVLRGRRFHKYLSKIGIESEEEFFDDLQDRIRGQPP